ncbi:P2X purinoceptor 4 isoform X2 [Myotis lucifugus]|uniref:P2X purinoceptor 4 isoform X2 n=1 Tax=Myotis lucifugus TaxID=59463 RepID=UPI000CCBE381|nr:P2X purinoceptor 4 isoform X2 [Myotis lucifugus]
MAGCCSVLGAFLFEYDTPRIVLIRSRKVGLMNRAVQLFILAYVIGWVFVWEKGYQEVDSVVSSVTTKAKGVAVTNTSQLGFRIWDVADYVIPAQEESSLFIMTNIIVTMNQTQGFCPELPDKKSVCKSDSNCPAGSTDTHSSGVATGRCVPYNGTLKTCEVAAWCPVEDDSNVPKPAFLKAAENFTLLVKNNIWYPKFNFTKRNILPNITTTYLKSCIYNAATDPFCPIFRLGKIVENAGHSFQDMAVEGGIMGIQIKWDCNLDRAASFCLPRYSFRRLDTRDLDHNVSPGYNFRFAKYYNDLTGTEHRTLIKAYGIRFDIIVFGKATVLCDVIVLYCMKKRYYYREKKYKYVEEYEQVDHPPNLSRLPPVPVVTTLSAGPDTPGSPTPPVSPAPALQHLP